MLALLPACGGMTTRPMGEDDPLVQENGTLLVEDGSYSTPEKVAEYLHFYGHLPQNYLTKQEAKALGWAASQGNLWEVAEGNPLAVIALATARVCCRKLMDAPGTSVM